MSGLRTFLIVMSGCMLVAVLGGRWLWQTYGSTFTGKIEELESEAEYFASTRAQDACVPEAFARLDRCDGILCQVELPAFTRICLRRASESPGLCSEVPTSLASAAFWPQLTCADSDASPEACDRILRELVRVCLARSDAD